LGDVWGRLWLGRVASGAIAGSIAAAPAVASQAFSDRPGTTALREQAEGAIGERIS
jgi:hypothetical protein